jgi:hypothetical protein
MAEQVLIARSLNENGKAVWTALCICSSFCRDDFFSKSCFHLELRQTFVIAVMHVMHELGTIVGVT